MRVKAMKEAVNSECLAARNSVGILDASTLGKIDIQGPDAAKFINLHLHQRMVKT